jgi:hypothetical protein
MTLCMCGGTSMGSVTKYLVDDATVPESAVVKDVALEYAVILDSDTHGVIDSIGPGELVVSPTRRIEPTMADENAVPVPVTVVDARAMVP